MTCSKVEVRLWGGRPFEEVEARQCSWMTCSKVEVRLWRGRPLEEGQCSGMTFSVGGGQAVK